MLPCLHTRKLEVATEYTDSHLRTKGVCFIAVVISHDFPSRYTVTLNLIREDIAHSAMQIVLIAKKSHSLT